VTGDLEEIRLRNPQFLNSLDRRETLALTSGSMCVALLSGWFVFYYPKLHACTAFLIGGVFLLVQFSTAISHLRRVRRAVREADALALSRKEPPKSEVDFKKLLQDLIKAATDALGKL
jgi:Na+/melibiose symporter-like transporter